MSDVLNGSYAAMNYLMSLGHKKIAIINGSKDFSIISCGSIHLRSELYPELTTMNQFPYHTWSIAAEKIINIINRNKTTERLVLIEPEIVIRESCRSLF